MTLPIARTIHFLRSNKRSISLRRTKYFIILSFCATTFFLNSILGRQAETPPVPTVKRLGDGCYNVFLDVGANIGVHGRFLFEREKYPDAKTARDIFDTQFGVDRDNRDFCSFEFEPNPAHRGKLLAKEAAYKSMGWRYHIMNVAASDHYGSMQFYHNQDTGREEWGFGVKKLTDKAEPVSIPVIRLASWIKHHVAERSIPADSFGSYSSGPKVVMKMDVEGTEFILLPDLIFTGALCHLDLVFGEFHERFAPMEFEGHRVELKTQEDTSRLRSSLVDVLHSSRNCNVTFVIADDEKYLHDGVPLPVANSKVPPMK